MKIGIVTPAFYPYPGGVTEHVFNSYRALGRLGHDVRVITTNFGACLDEGGQTSGEGIRSLGRRDSISEPDIIRIGKAVSIPANGSICPVALDIRMANQLRGVFDAERFDVIHLHEPLMPALCLSALGQTDVPAVGTFHASNDTVIGYKLFRPILERYSRKLRGRIAVSEAAKRTALRYFDGDYRIIPNGVDVERFAGAEPIEELMDGSLNMLFVGRMEPRKGAKFLFKALPEIMGRVPNSRLIVVGGGPLSSYYGSFVPESCRSRIRFEGFVSSTMLARYYASAHIFCSPATGGESFGIVLLEAMAAGAAIVASDIVGYRGVLENEKTGLLTRPASPDSIAEAVVRLAEDDGLRNQLVSNGRERVERYSWDRVTREIADVYESAIASGDVFTGGAGATRTELADDGPPEDGRVGALSAGRSKGSGGDVR